MLPFKNADHPLPRLRDAMKPGAQQGLFHYTTHHQQAKSPMTTRITSQAQQNASTNSINLVPLTSANPGATSGDASAGPDLDNDDIEAQYPKGIKLWLILITLGAILTLTAMDINIIAPAVPSITDHFHTVTDVGWYSSAFRLCMCAFQFMFGKAYTLFPVKRVFMLSNCISIVGSLLCGVATSSAMLVVGRAVAGFGAAGLFSGFFSILVQSSPLRRRPMLIGVLCSAEGIATLAAPMVGGVITQALGWRWCFYLIAAIGGSTLLLTMLFLSSSSSPAAAAGMTLRQKLAKMDLLSNLLLIPALTSLFLALSWAGTKYAWSSGNVIGPLVAFVALAAAFVYSQSRRDDDSVMLPARILRHRTVIASFIFVACTNSVGNVLEYYLPTYYQIVRGYDVAKSGYLLLPNILSATIGGLIHGVGTSAWGHYAPFMLFASVTMPIATGLMTTIKVDTGLVSILAISAFSGFAYGIGFTGPQNAVQTVLEPEDVPLGVAIVLFAQAFGPAVAVAVAQVLFTNQLAENLKGFVPELGSLGGGTSEKGLTELISHVPPQNMTMVLEGVDKSVTQTWYLVVGLACMTMVGSLLVEWRSVKTKRD